MSRDRERERERESGEWMKRKWRARNVLRIQRNHRALSQENKILQ